MRPAGEETRGSGTELARELPKRGMLIFVIRSVLGITIKYKFQYSFIYYITVYNK